ncbi:uncharacterized protein LOC131884726 [Tigriopus californicus]|nr:uncharacterized protein LOC131884726 [Tigriopus californicus]
MPTKGSVKMMRDENGENAPPTLMVKSGASSHHHPHHIHTGPVVASATLRKDVDSLVLEIKENLKLGSHKGRKAATGRHHRGSHRATPYHVPPSSRVACDNVGDGNAIIPSQLKRWNQRRRYPSTCMSSGKETDNPFEMLQELISDGSLIKEAVRRLQLGLTPKFASRSFYDSDDECRTPPAYEGEDTICCEVGGSHGGHGGRL